MIFGSMSFSDFDGAPKQKDEREEILEKVFSAINGKDLHNPDNVDQIDAACDKLEHMLKNIDVDFDVAEMRQTLKTKFHSENNVALVKAIYKSANAMERTFNEGIGKGRKPNVETFYSILMMTVCNLDQIGAIKILDKKAKK